MFEILILLVFMKEAFLADSESLEIVYEFETGSTTTYWSHIIVKDVINNTVYLNITCYELIFFCNPIKACAPTPESLEYVVELKFFKDEKFEEIIGTNSSTATNINFWMTNTMSIWFQESGEKQVVDAIYIKGIELFKCGKTFDDYFIRTQKARLKILGNEENQLSPLENSLVFKKKHIEKEGVEISVTEINYFAEASIDILQTVPIIFKKDSHSETICLNLKEEYEQVKVQEESLSVKKTIEFCGQIITLSLELTKVENERGIEREIKREIHLIGFSTMEKITFTQTTSETLQIKNPTLQIKNPTLKIMLQITVAILLLFIILGLFFFRRRKKLRRKFNKDSK